VLIFGMQSPNDDLLSNADAAVAEARRLRAELRQSVATAQELCRLAKQAKILADGLNPTLWISLLVRAD
jgi:hypothetical protein